MKFSKVSKFSLPTLVAAVLMAGFATSPTPSRAECNSVCQQKYRNSYWRADTGVGLPDSERLANCINEWFKSNEAVRAARIRAGLQVRPDQPLHR
jgi:hypothetical protein